MTLELSPGLEDLFGDSKEELLALAMPVVEFDFGMLATDPSTSYAGGYPFMPEGAVWPTGKESGEPMAFLMQVNFAELPTALPHFPTSGLLQWFVDGADDTFGLTFGTPSAGLEGFEVRYYPEPDLDSSAPSPTSPCPYPAGETMYGPLEQLAPSVLIFEAHTRLPHWGEFYEGELRNKVSEELEEALEEAVEDSDLEVELAELMVPEFSVGGAPVLIQGDPRHSRNRANQVILQLGSDQAHFMWGDLGTAQLFGDPEALARGDLSSFWWDWACS